MSNDNLSGTGRSRRSTMGMGVAIAIAVVLLIVGIGAGYVLGTQLNKSSSSSTSTTQITETGSSLLYPLLSKTWGPNYTSTYNSNVVLSAASTGSGTGQSDAEQGLVDIGASDGYLSNASATSLINVPVAISAQLIYYNLPGVTGHLNLNGTVLAEIYSQNITTWNNPLILNAQTPSVQTQLNGLSSETIWTVKRGDSSGDTFLFSSLCYMSWTGWKWGAPSTSALTGLTGTNVITETGNSGMVTGVDGQVGAIAYIGIAYENTIATSTVNYAAIGDNNSLSAAGGVDAANYVLPTQTNISADANLGLTHLEFSTYQLAVSLILGGSPAGAINLIAGAGGTTPVVGTTPYPIVNLEYTLIKTTNRPNSQAIVLFLQWAISFGNLPKYLNTVNFVPLTPEVVGYDMQELATVQT